MKLRPRIGYICTPLVELREPRFCLFVTVVFEREVRGGRGRERGRLNDVLKEGWKQRSGR